jgi:nicotinate-nucleotide--dimethylbenzimidazole phosphoribosyltransferase
VTSDPAELCRLIAAVGPLDEAAMAAARARQAQLIKPPGSLGRLEELACQLAGITGQPRPRLERAVVLVLAADHGVVSEGVSAYPAAVTAQMARAVLAGQAAISVLARQAGAAVQVIDIGTAGDGVAAPAASPGGALIVRKWRRGTANLAAGPALARAEALAALTAGAAIATAAAAAGGTVVLTGELGIGNTTAAAALTAVMTGQPPAATTGRGAGLDDAGLRRKIAIVERALAVNRPDPADPLGVLAAVGGLEIAGLVGVILGAAAGRAPVVLDGYITGAAALVAVALCPAARGYLIAGHCSAEPGHRLALAHLGLAPLLDLDLRLGEGTGAVLALPLVRAAAATLDQMATFAEAGAAGKGNR